ncbi:hypothetical protein [Pseudomonas sp. CGJS7]|uniref:hypothetical protein n=1 Tax=Pseudomonas sp. CGJS7 TaxID=3109348 RepID=UPI00300A0AC9
MATPKQVKILGRYDLNQIARAIMYWEANRRVFKGNEIIDEPDQTEAIKSAKCNRATFERHPDATYPNDCKLQFDGDPAPADHEREWSGDMIVEAKKKKVVLYRSKTKP